VLDIGSIAPALIRRQPATLSENGDFAPPAASQPTISPHRQLGITIAHLATSEAIMRSSLKSRQRRGISEVAERQMRRWALDIQAGKERAEENAKLEVRQLIKPYMVLSREAGVDAADIANAISDHCGWKVLDRELLDYLAEHDHLSRLALDFVDERSVSWFHEMFGTWLEKQLVSQAEYVSRLGRLVLLAAQHENSIFVGRGVQFMLPRELGFTVRFIAPLKQRDSRMKMLNACTEREARRQVDELDENRQNFVKRYFQHDITDPHLYDLVINLGFVPREEAASLVANEAARHAERVRLNLMDRALLRSES
jgi:cytidylate kinase